VLGLLLLAIAARWQTFGNPVIGFDEQFYLLVGDRMWLGVVPYVDIFDRKPIGLFLIYAGARALGGDGFLQYKLVALAFVVATAYLIYRATKPVSSKFAASIAACLYILWLNFMEGEGGQGEIFLNLPMLAAALLVWRASVERLHIISRGAVAMLLVGLALQIKYTAVFEGVFFGCALLWVQYRARPQIAALIGPGLVWIACALLPTAIAMLVYWHIGALNAFVFANFLSIAGKHGATLWSGLAVIIGVLLPLALLATPTLRKRRPDLLFVKLWLGAAIVAVLAFRTFGNAHYGIPIVVPLCILAAPWLARPTRAAQFLGVGLLSLFFVGGQIVLARVAYLKGGAEAATTIARAAKPRHGCIYVYDGYPALYLLTQSCVPTRWAFPGHLNTQEEASPRALGVDPVAEVKRILATKPDVIIDDDPVYEGGNRATHALVLAAEAQDYELALRYRTGTSRYRLVYRRKDTAL
jgi:hypothetical protein